MAVSERDCARQVLEVTPRMMRWLAVRMHQHAGADGLTVPQFRILHYVQCHGGCSQGDVTRWRDVAAATMSRSVDALVEKGYVERRRSDSDRRRVFLYLTPAGERFLAEVHAHMERTLAAELARLSAAQRSSIARGLAELATLINSPKRPAESPARRPGR